MSPGAPGASCRVRVPATTANIGPGLRLSRAGARPLERGPVLPRGRRRRRHRRGSGPGWACRATRRNLVARAFLRLCEEAGRARAGRPSHPLRHPRADELRPRLELHGHRGRPARRQHAVRPAVRPRPRSSSWPPTWRATPTTWRRPCSAASPSSSRRQDRLLTKKILVPEVHVALAVPDLPFSTNAARAELPTEVSMVDAVFNLQRTPLVVEALRTGDYELLSQVMDDRLHQASRLKRIPGGRTAWLAALNAGGGRGRRLRLRAEPHRLRQSGDRRLAHRARDGRGVRRRGRDGDPARPRRLGRRRDRDRLNAGGTTLVGRSRTRLPRLPAARSRSGPQRLPPARPLPARCWSGEAPVPHSVPNSVRDSVPDTVRRSVLNLGPHPGSEYSLAPRGDAGGAPDCDARGRRRGPSAAARRFREFGYSPSMSAGYPSMSVGYELVDHTADIGVTPVGPDGRGGLRAGRARDVLPGLRPARRSASSRPWRWSSRPRAWTCCWRRGSTSCSTSSRRASWCSPSSTCWSWESAPCAPASAASRFDTGRHIVCGGVKAATLHELSLEHRDDGWEGFVLLDV